MKKAFLVFILLLAGCSSKDNFSDKTALGIVSFHQGYMRQQRLNILDESYNIDHFIEGIKAAKKGESHPFTEEELKIAYETFHDEILEKQSKDNLALAEAYLKKIGQEEQVVELVPQKLYYKTIKTTDKEMIMPEDLLECSYKAFVLESDEEKELFSNSDSTVTISLADAIPGFSKGLHNMRIDERRKLYIHPDLAYGSYGGKLKPNQLVIIDVEVTGVVH